MIRIPIFFAVIVSLVLPKIGQAQTPYPMLMSLKPVAAQVGKTSEHTVQARYNLYGAYQVLVSGTGVTGEVAPPEKPKDGKEPNLTKLKIKFTVAADAKPGVREFRLATPRGVSTIGQLVIGRDGVVTEAAKNNTSAEAQTVTLPATLCGAIEKSEDVDYYKFQVDAGTTLCFHMRAMRLQDKIHDLQQHVDPIITLRNAMGTTLAAVDNVYFADPVMAYQFDEAGEYLLEVRDVRYQGNANWVYSIEVSNRPFVSGVHPMGIPRGEETNLELIGLNISNEQKTTLTVPMEAPLGPQRLEMPLNSTVTNPVPVVVSELPIVIEAETDNNSPDTAQIVSLPAGISGRINQENDIDCFAFEAKKGEKFSFEVIARRQQSTLDSHLRILNADGKQLKLNDDLRLGKRNFADSWIENWQAPA